MITAIDIQKQERSNRRKARILAFLLLILLLFAFILPFISAELETSKQYEKVIMIDFSDQFHDARAAAERSSAEAAKEAADNESTTTEEPVEEEEIAAVEEVEPVEETDVVEEIVEEPVVEPIPTVEPIESVQDKPLVTSETSDVPVNVKSMMKEISEKAVVKKVEKEVTEVTEKASSGMMDDIAKFFGNSSNSGGTSKANGSGKSATAGEGTSGSSDRGDSDFDGKADSGISPSDFDYDGLLSRKVIRRAEVKSLIKKTGRIVINLCVNRDGQVIYSKVDRETTTLKDPVLIQKAETTAKRYRYEKDYTVAPRQCGKLSFIVDIEK